MRIKTKKIFILYYLLSTLLIGCASVSKRPPAPPKDMQGAYHRVQKGQTLWRISQVYDVELEKITRANRLPDSSRIYTGQLIFIPEAKQALNNLTLESDFQGEGGDFIWPVKGKISSFFGMKRSGVKNKGVFIQARSGTEIKAARSGRIAFCSEGLKGYGKMVIIDHLDGYSTVYAQNSRNLVKFNQLVRQGEVIARAGRARQVQPAELYFEIRKEHKPQNPFFYLP